jgi:protein-arginine kinase
MLEKIVQTTANLLRLATDVQQNREEIKETRKENREVVEIVQRLQMTVEQVPENERRERELFKLEVENLILRQNGVLMLPAPPALPAPAAAEP